MAGSFDPPTLEQLRSTEEVEIETRRAPGAAPHRTIIWVVVDADDRVFIRSVRGEAGRWYREAIADRGCVLWLDAIRLPVSIEPATSPEEVASCSRELRSKYAADPSTPSMVRADVLSTTLQLRPRRAP